MAIALKKCGVIEDDVLQQRLGVDVLLTHNL